MTDFKAQPRPLHAALLACGWLLVIATLGCGSADATASNSAPSALTTTDRTHAGRATAYTAEAARYRDIASQQRQLSAAYARWTPPARASKNWNETLKARADARAAAVDQVATKLQAIAAFHLAEAAKEGAR
jgi:hypothetical protein